jgi:hypothetical protein
MRAGDSRNDREGLHTRSRAALVLLLGAAFAWTAPLLGLALADQALTPYLRFPPLTQPHTHAPFSWPAFIATSLTLVVLGALLVVRGGVRIRPRPPGPSTGRFPRWGIVGLALIAVAWLLAWTEGIAPPDLRRQTFAVLWLGYILAINAIAYRRAGESLLTHRSGSLLVLFPVSAGYWWLFEHLNQFVGNWYYSGEHADNRWDYFVQATLPFATVLPAVASTRAWLRSSARIDFERLPRVRGHPTLAWLALASG